MSERPGPEPRNRLLEWYRIDRGWSRAELARQVNASIQRCGDHVAPVSETTVKRWEREHWPKKAYSKHLCLIFDMAASDLGLLTTAELAMRPTLATKARGSGSVDDDTIVAGREVPTVPEADMRWALALHAAGVPLDVPEIRILSDPRHLGAAPSPADPVVVDAYGALVALLRDRYWDGAPELMLDAAREHLRVGEALRDSVGGDHAALASAVAECALIGARLAVFDLDDHTTTAASMFAAATRAVAAAQNHSLAIAIAAHKAFAPGFAGDTDTARGFLDAAFLHYRRSERHPLARSWLHCVTAEVLAHGGQRRTSMRHIRLAREPLHQDNATEHAPAWLDFYDASRWCGFAGNTALLAGRPSAAVVWLNQALEQLDPRAARQRPVLLLDLAAAHAADDPAHAFTVASTACDHLAHRQYRTAADRIPAVVHALAGTRYADDLIERARTLPRHSA